MREVLNSILHNVEGLGSASLFLFLLTIFILLGLWSGLGRSQLVQLLRGPSASNLFLTVRMQVVGERGVSRGRSSGSKEFVGHVTGLNERSVTFLSPIALSRGDHIALELSSLPDFPEASEAFKVKVQRATTIKGKPASYLVHSTFVSLADPAKAPLAAYLTRLSGAVGGAEPS